MLGSREAGLGVAMGSTRVTVPESSQVPHRQACLAAEQKAPRDSRAHPAGPVSGVRDACRAIPGRKWDEMGRCHEWSWLDRVEGEEGTQDARWLGGRVAWWNSVEEISITSPDASFVGAFAGGTDCAVPIGAT